MHTGSSGACRYVLKAARSRQPNSAKQQRAQQCLVRTTCLPRLRFSSVGTRETPAERRRPQPLATAARQRPRRPAHLPARPPMREFKRSQTQVTCGNDGCTWEGEHSELAAHERHCAPWRCPGCGATVPTLDARAPHALACLPAAVEALRGERDAARAGAEAAEAARAALELELAEVRRDCHGGRGLGRCCRRYIGQAAR